MYSDEDFDHAIKQGIFTRESVERFRTEMSQHKQAPAADEENFKLITGFNDIFVVIACTLLLVSSGWAAFAIHPAASAALVAALSWGLAEFFVQKRKMALPAIFLLVAFVSAIFFMVMALFGEPQIERAFMLAGMASAIGAWLHWKRFRVPITVAAGMLAGVVFVIFMLLSIFPATEDYLAYLLFVSGAAVFATALYWDSTDLTRVTRKSDVAFWLHLASAPLIVHPVFTGAGFYEGAQNLSGLSIIIGLYFLLTLISLIIDRRAFMVSSLIYVLIALTEFFELYGLADDSFAYVGMIIGFSLLLLSGLWHKARKIVLSALPEMIQRKVPAATI